MASLAAILPFGRKERRERERRDTDADDLLGPDPAPAVRGRFDRPTNPVPLSPASERHVVLALQGARRALLWLTLAVLVLAGVVAFASHPP